MNAKLENFINLKKSEHLISLGLIDESKTVKRIKYTHEYQPGGQYDYERKMFYSEVIEYAPIDITDEEYHELLIYAPINKKKEEGTKQSTEVKQYSKTIMIISDIILVLNLIMGGFGLIMCFRSHNVLEAMPFCCLFIFALLGLLWSPIIKGFANVVASAEKNLTQKNN